MKLRLLTLGKTREKWLEEGLEDYKKRLSYHFEIIICKNREKLEEQASKERRCILLDPRGLLMTSEQFSQFLMREIELGGAQVTFVIGDAQGLPPGLKGEKISFSPLTFTHQMMRLILAEQLFRAFEIARGSPYHK